MSGQSPFGDENENYVTVRYWARARSAAGVESDRVRASTLADVLSEISRLHADRDGFDDVVEACSILVDEIAVGSRDPAAVVVSPGDTVELLPPFAGG